MITLDDIEAKAWHVAAEPAESRMEELLDAVREFAAVKNGRAHSRSVARLTAVSRQHDAGSAEAAAEAAPELAAQLTALPPAGAEASAEAREDAVSEQQATEPPRICKGCDITKPAGDFSRDKSLRSGRRGKCRACEAKARAERKLRAADAARDEEAAA